MNIERERAIQKEYDKIVEKVVGGRLYGEYVTSPKELVVAAYLVGLNEGKNQPTSDAMFSAYVE